MDKRFRFHPLKGTGVSGFRWLLFATVLLVLLAINVQWHYDRMCATVFSSGAYFKLDGVYCEVNVQGVEFRLDELLARHDRVRQQMECMIANPDKDFMCDPRWIPADNEGSG